MPDEPDGQNQLPKPEDGKSSNDQKTTGAPDKPQKKYRINPYQFRCATLIFDGLLVLVGVVYSFFAYQQWQAMSGQLTEMRKSNEATTSAARSAEASVRQAKETAHLDQRAWVALEKVDVVPEAGKGLRITATIKNTGKTFAKHTEGCVSPEECVKGTNPYFGLEEKRISCGGATIGLLAPNGEFSGILNHSSGSVVEASLPAIKSGEVRFFLHGRIDYEDIFGCKHWTTFCGVLNSDLTSFRSYGTHNEADDNNCTETDQKMPK